VTFLKRRRRTISRLQRFPTLWKIALSFYEVVPFNPSKFYYWYQDTDKSYINRELKQYNLVFDAQCLQTATRQRGIGKYSLKFIEAVCNERKTSSFAAVLTTIASPADVALAVMDLENLRCSNLDIVVLDPFEGRKRVSFNQARNFIGRCVENTNCETVISLSPFEKHKSVITFPKSVHYKLVGILYDLIRLQYPEQFLFSRKQKTSFNWSLEHLRQYQLLLAISKETKNRWTELVGGQPNIVVIHGGCESNHNVSWKSFQERSGILCVGAEQPHKNIEGLILAYSRLPTYFQISHPLTVVGIRSNGSRARFSKLARRTVGRVNLPEYLSSSELEFRYQNSRLLVMPSFVEGLSLPILEAWSYGLIAIGSVGTVAEEIIQDPRLLFDPFNPEEIKNRMQQYLSSNPDWDASLEHTINKKSVFTWPETARKALTAIEGLAHGQS
jgi:glycosyltransferase involved in cell wall biosynthesis